MEKEPPLTSPPPPPPQAASSRPTTLVRAPSLLWDSISSLPWAQSIGGHAPGEARPHRCRENGTQTLSAPLPRRCDETYACRISPAFLVRNAGHWSRSTGASRPSLPQRHALASRICPARPAFARAHDAVQAARLRADAHGMAHALQLRRKPFEPRALLEVGRAVAAAHVRAIDRLL